MQITLSKANEKIVREYAERDGGRSPTSLVNAIIADRLVKPRKVNLRKFVRGGFAL